LFVMGFGFSGAAWRGQVDDLRADHDTCWYDNRGIGASSAGPTPDGRYDLPALADDAAALLDHLGWADAHIVGVSMGGMVAQHLVLRRPERVRSLTLIATHPGGLDMLPSPLGLYWFSRANLSRGAARLDALANLLFPAKARSRLRQEGWFEQQLAPVAGPSDPGVRLRQMAGILNHDVRKELQGVRAPSLVVRPALDLLVPPRGSDVISAAIPGARLVNFPDAGHGVISQERDRVNHEIRAHIHAAEGAKHV
jgi:pimeloyl-ACP methyl ester carboxylesterase